MSIYVIIDITKFLSSYNWTKCQQQVDKIGNSVNKFGRVRVSSYGLHKFEILAGLDTGFLSENVIDVWSELSRVNVGGPPS